MLGDKTIFFIEDNDTAMKLKQIGNLPSAGGELRVVVKPSPPPLQGRGVCMSVCLSVCLSV